MNLSTLLKLMRKQKEGATCSIDEIDGDICLSWHYQSISKDGRVIYFSHHARIKEAHIGLQHRQFVNLLKYAALDLNQGK